MAPPDPATPTFGIMSIATNVYLKYWMALATSLDQHVRSCAPLTLHLFTDQPDAAKEFAQTLERCSVVVHEIEPLRWPEATLFRYKILSENLGAMPQDLLMYLDADTIVNADFEHDLPQRIQDAGVLLVEQAGSWRPPRFHRRVRFYLYHPGAILQDLRKHLREGGLGTWETRPSSTAFVPRGERKEYVSGAVWMGTREGLGQMLSELASRVQQDWNNDIVAVWHDESHLNWWSSRYRPTLTDPRYYFFPGQRHLDELPNIIALVAKDEITR